MKDKKSLNLGMKILIGLVAGIVVGAIFWAVMGADNDMFAAQMTLVLNARNPLVAYVYEHREDEKTELFVRQIFDLALLANRPLTPDEMSEFVTRSNEILLQMTR